MDPEKSSTLEYARPLRRRTDLHPILGILGIPLAFISGLLLMSTCALILDLAIEILMPPEAEQQRSSGEKLLPL